VAVHGVGPTVLGHGTVQRGHRCSLTRWTTGTGTVLPFLVCVGAEGAEVAEDLADLQALRQALAADDEADDS
jgi:hypothetical protein